MSKQNNLFYYLTGFITAAIIVGLIGSDEIIQRLYVFKVKVVEKNKSEVLDIPLHIRDEMLSKGVVFDNYDVKVHETKHDTVLVTPDPTRRFKLRPNVHIDGYLLEAKNALNLDPPGVFMLHGTSLSEEAMQYLNANTRTRFSYTVNAQGFRTTLPDSNADSKWLIVGDSVAFGVGVSDSETIPSQLQQIFQDRHKIVNAAVGSYHTKEIFATSKQLLEKDEYVGLVYIACQNDFHSSDNWSQVATDILLKLKQLTDQHNVKLIVMLQTYLQFNLNDVLREQGWSSQKIRLTEALRRDVRALTDEQGIDYLDWADIVRQFRNQKKSIFAPFALYVDHSHFSPQGNKLAAEKISTLMN